MIKRILLTAVFALVMLCLLPGGVALAVTFGFNTEEAEADYTISDTNSGDTLQISSSAAEDYVTNCTIPVDGTLTCGTQYMDGYAVYIAYLDTGTYANLKPHGTITVSVEGGKVFSVESFVCGNGGADDTLAITTGSTTETFFVTGLSNALVTPSPAFQGITSFTLSWSNNDHEMYFDNFNISFALAPTNIALDNASIPENTASGTKVGGLTTTDSDSASFTYTLAESETYPDNANFTIAGSDLKLNMVPDYENKASYSIRIQTEDDTGLTYLKTFTISITDVNEAPSDISLSNSSIAENSASGTTIGTLSGTDPDTPSEALTYFLPAGMGDNASFSLAGNTLKLAVVPNFEVKNSYAVTARASDGSLTFDKVFTILITNVNEAPTGLTLSASAALEHSPIGTTVGILSGGDPDAGSSFTYSFVAGAGDTDNGSFTIDTDALMLGIEPDYEVKDTYSIRIRVSDGSLSFDKEFTITILDGNDPPTDITITGGSIAENAAPGSSVGSLASIDNPGDTFTYTFTAGAGDTDNAGFTLTGNVLKMNSSADYEAKNSYSVRIRSMDNHGLYYEKAFTILISNVNEAPTDMALSNNTIAENSDVGTTIGTLSGTDPDAVTTLSFSLTDGLGDNECFTISENSLKLAVKPDFEAKNTYSVFIRESDGALTFDKVFTINITDANDAPTDISITSSSMLEHSAVDTAVGNLFTNDQDGGAFTYSLAAGAGSTDNASFSISGNTLKISLSPNFEVKSSYSIRIRTTDSTALYYEKVFIINITDGDDPPSDISLTNQSIAENLPDGTVIGTLSSTDESGGGPFTFTYTLASGSGDTDNDRCIIDGNALKLVAAPNYEVKNSYSIRIRTSNETTHFYYEKAFTITITDVNERPTGINLSSSNITEHISSGTTVAVITGTDPDAGSTFTYALVSGIGDADNASFTISGNELKLAVVPDYEVRPTYNIRIRVTDNSSLTYDKDFILIVINGNDPPADLFLTSSSIQENIPSGNVFTLFGCVDINGGDMSFSLVNGTGSTDNDKFTLSGNMLSMSVVPDYEAKSTYLIRARVTDSGGLYYEKAFTIAVENMPEAPTDIVLSNTRIVETTPTGTAIGTLSGTDPDAGSTFTYALAAGAGDTDNASFTITGNTLKSALAFDYDTQNSYSIRIRIIDETSLWYEKQFTLSVTVPVAEITVTGTDGATSIRAGRTLQMLAGVSPADATDKSITWSISSGSGATISAGGLLNATAAGSVTVRATAGDGSGVYGELILTITAASSGGDGSSNLPATQTYKADVESDASSDTTLPVTVNTENGSAGVEVGSGNGLMSEDTITVITVPSVPGVNTYTLGIPVPDLSTPEAQGALSLNTDAGSVTVPSNMLTGIAGISGAKALVAIGYGDKTKLPEDVKAAIGDKPLVHLTLSIDGRQTSWNNPDAPVTVSIAYAPTAAELANPESIVVWYIDGSGKVVSIPNGHYDPATGMVTFETTHFSDYAVVFNPVSFSDVASNAWYSKAVSFIAARGITSGAGNGKYSPEAKLTRGEFIVLMLRAYGIEPDENPSDNFSDAGSTGYAGYLAAAKRLGISAGVGNNLFAPGKEITRQEMFTQLYNALKVIGKLPQGDSGKRLSDFSDAGQINEWAREAMTTFVMTGTVSGSGGILAPTGTTTRAVMAQVLYNLLAK